MTPWTSQYLAAREQAGSPDGEAFNQRLREMGPQAAAKTVAGMFCLCADEDLEIELCYGPPRKG
jgi:hypothetical protein